MSTVNVWCCFNLEILYSLTGHESAEVFFYYYFFFHFQCLQLDRGLVAFLPAQPLQ